MPCGEGVSNSNQQSLRENHSVPGTDCADCQGPRDNKHNWVLSQTTETVITSAQVAPRVHGGSMKALKPNLRGQSWLPGESDTGAESKEVGCDLSHYNKETEKKST